MTQLKSEGIGKLAGALSKAQSKFTGAVKDAQNPFYKSKYADLESVWEAIKGPLSENGLSVTQTTDITETGTLVLITILMHAESGEWVMGKYPLNPKANDPQSLGSAVTYARRYALAAMVGMYQVDDDANQASGK